MRTCSMIAYVNNTPEHLVCTYVVGRVYQGELWYYGQYELYDQAMDVAQDVGGVVLEAE